MYQDTIRQNQRISFAQKNANKKAWYKEQADIIYNNHIYG